VWHIWVNVWDLGKLCVSRFGRGWGVGDIRGEGGKRCEIGWEWVRMGENGRKWVKMDVYFSEKG
jgi:hypothetical protein